MKAFIFLTIIFMSAGAVFAGEFTSEQKEIGNLTVYLETNETIKSMTETIRINIATVGKSNIFIYRSEQFPKMDLTSTSVEDHDDGDKPSVFGFGFDF